MFKPFIINRPVFFGAALVIAIFLAISVALPSRSGELFGSLQAATLGASAGSTFLQWASSS